VDNHPGTSFQLDAVPNKTSTMAYTNGGRGVRMWKLLYTPV